MADPTMHGENLGDGENLEDGENLGRVVSLSGSKVIGLIKAGQANGSSALQIGSLVKMRTVGATVYGMVNGLSIPIPSQEEVDDELRIAEMELVGEVPNLENGQTNGFRRGVSTSPALGDRVYETTPADMNLIYATACRAVNALIGLRMSLTARTAPR